GTIGGRIRGARFKPGRTAQIVIAPGDGSGPLRYYEAKGDPTQTESWIGRDLLDREMIHGHTLDVGDINDDGKLDIFAGEMGKWDDKPGPMNNTKATAWILYGDGKGGFQTTVFRIGDGWHDGKLGDFDNDGRLDILNKPYEWDVPRVDLWLNKRGR
ncbi:MAG TPA: VCBS repeat-containing protein, partial [Bryobacteraceae bacterium]